jgi:hypothetical protein
MPESPIMAIRVNSTVDDEELSLGDDLIREWLAGISSISI